MKNKMKQYRQGDVLIEQVAELPSGSLKQTGRVILASGDATGHAHEIFDNAKAFLCEKVMFIEVGKGMATVSHHEHNAISLPAGIYRITRQREYTPEAIRNVAD